MGTGANMPKLEEGVALDSPFEWTAKDAKSTSDSQICLRETASFQEKHLREVRTARFASEKIPGVTLAFIKQDFRSSLCSSTCSW